MNILDNIFRVFMFVLPYGLCLAAYVWVGGKAWKAPAGAARIASLVIVAGGAAYTLYKLLRGAGGIFSNDNFEFAIIIVTVFVLFFASVALALAEPEKDKA